MQKMFDSSLHKSITISNFARLSHIKLSCVRIGGGVGGGIGQLLLEPSSLLTRFQKCLLPNDSALIFSDIVEK